VSWGKAHSRNAITTSSTADAAQQQLLYRQVTRQQVHTDAESANNDEIAQTVVSVSNHENLI
jgi:hypothetical protein